MMPERLDDAVGALDILSPDEKRMITETWNRTDATYPDDPCLHHLFERQVADTPEACAIICGTGTGRPWRRTP